jgi:hypothetical protein
MGAFLARWGSFAFMLLGVFFGGVNAGRDMAINAPGQAVLWDHIAAFGSLLGLVGVVGLFWRPRRLAVVETGQGRF